MWYIAKALQMLGLAQVLIGVFVGISQDNLATEYKIAAIGLGFFLIGRLVEGKSKKGSFPRIHEQNLNSQRFFNGYLQTYLERDVRALINLKDLGRFQQFLTLLAGRVGQIINYSSLSNDIGVSATSVKNWLSVLKASFVIFELKPRLMTPGKDKHLVSLLAIHNALNVRQ